MSKALLHTPVGVRDVYGKECAVKLTIENNINKPHFFGNGAIFILKWRWLALFKAKYSK